MQVDRIALGVGEGAVLPDRGLDEPGVDFDDGVGRLVERSDEIRGSRRVVYRNDGVDEAKRIGVVGKVNASAGVFRLVSGDGAVD